MYSRQNFGIGHKLSYCDEQKKKLIENDQLLYHYQIQALLLKQFLMLSTSERKIVSLEDQQQRRMY
jgi:hypothetical protein